MGVSINFYVVAIRMMSLNMTTNEDDEETLTICAEAPNVDQFEANATVEMMVTENSLTS